MARLTDDQKLQVLLGWRTDAVAAGHQVPDYATLEKIIESNSVAGAPAGSEASVAGWSDTITFLLRQMNMGVVRPDLPVELMSPVGADPTQRQGPATIPAPSAAPAETPTESTAWVTRPAASTPPSAPVEEIPVADRRFAALKAWRDEQVAAGVEGVASLKDAHLRPIARSASGLADDIGAMLPASASRLSSAMAAVLAPFSAQSAPPPSIAPAEGFPAATVPAAAPPPVAQVAPPASPAPPSAHGVVDYGSFAAYAFGAQTAEPAPVRGAYVGGELSLSWDRYPVDGQFVIYRVVSGDEYAPYNPDQADVITVTEALAATDSRPHRSAMRFVQVWAQVGAESASARTAQPVLLAQGVFVAQPFNVDIREDEGRVIGQWQVWPGISRVLVYRIPIERAAQGSGSAEYQIRVNEDNLGGFVDADALRGSRYLYQFWAEADVDSRTQLATPIAQDVVISDIIEQVTELTFTADGDDESPQFDLAWTAPRGGQVVIYRTAQPPRAGAALKPLPEGALEQTGLVASDRLAHPIDRGPEGSSAMKNVPWPRDWTRAYFTPVTLLAGQAFVGTTTSSARTDSIAHAKIIERVTSEILTFSWPVGAASVHVYFGPAGLPAEVAMRGGQPKSISAEQYKADGGLRFLPPLPAGGGALHAVPVTFLGGERIEGTPTTIIYPPLIRIRYELKQQRNLLGAITGITVSLMSQADLDRPPSFALVHNPTRFPLSIRDGEALTMGEDGMEGVAPGKLIRPRSLSSTAPNAVWKADSESWKSEVQKATGYLRLFVNEPAERLVGIALLDPPPSQLQLVSLARKIGLAGG